MPKFRKIECVRRLSFFFLILGYNVILGKLYLPEARIKSIFGSRILDFCAFHRKGGTKDEKHSENFNLCGTAGGGVLRM